MGSAIGSSYSGRDHGSHVYDVRDFGAIPEVSTNAAALANSIAFQLAYDTAYANRGASLGGGKVYVPSGTWFLGTPVFCDKNYIGFVGDGVSATAINGLSYSDIFVLGIPRRPTGAPPTADHFPDAWTAGPGSTPIYDASAVTGPGRGDHPAG